MRGTFRDIEERARAKEEWRINHVPDYVRYEVRPLLPLLSRQEGLVLIDVGANKGFWSKAALLTLTSHIHHIYALDPSPENYNELVRRDDNLIFDNGDFDFFSAHMVAAGAEAKSATLYTDEDGSPVASLYPHEFSCASGALSMGDSDGEVRSIQLTKSIDVEMTTIDRFIDNYRIGHVDILKIDTEGNEYEVLMGAQKALSKGAIDCVFFEFGSHQVESRTFFVDFYKLFLEHGFEMYHVFNAHAVRINSYSYEFENFSGIFTFAARRKAASLGNLSAGFNEAFYLQRNPDVAKAVSEGKYFSGWAHWLAFGEIERRVPPEDFDESLYLEANPDVKSAVEAGKIESGWNHWREYGQLEGREWPR